VSLEADVAKLRARLLERYRPGSVDLTEATLLVTDGWLDSFAIVELVVFMESELGLHLPAEEITPRNFSTLGSLRRLLERVRTGSR